MVSLPYCELVIVVVTNVSSLMYVYCRVAFYGKVELLWSHIERLRYVRFLFPMTFGHTYCSYFARTYHPYEMS